MHNPVREQIKLVDRWHVRPVDNSTLNVFVPGSWENKQVSLVPANGDTWAGASAGDQALSYDESEGSWLAEGYLTPGQWNTISTPTGPVSSARLVASNSLHITTLQATRASERSLSIRVRLSDATPRAEGTVGGEAPCLRTTGLLSLFFTLSTADGRQLGGMDVTISRKARDLSVEMPLPEPVSGSYRLKACLCSDDSVIDNARVDLSF